MQHFTWGDTLSKHYFISLVTEHSFVALFLFRFFFRCSIQCRPLNGTLMVGQEKLCQLFDTLENDHYVGVSVCLPFSTNAQYRDRSCS